MPRLHQCRHATSLSQLACRGCRVARQSPTDPTPLYGLAPHPRPPSGAAYNPYECKPADHVLPTAGRIPLHPGAGVTLDDLQRLLGPIATSAASPKDKEKESKEKESKEKDRDTREGREREVGSTRASDSG